MRGREKRLEFAGSFFVCYNFRLLYTSGTQYPILGALRYIPRDIHLTHRGRFFNYLILMTLIAERHILRNMSFIKGSISNLERRNITFLGLSMKNLLARREVLCLMVVTCKIFILNIKFHFQKWNTQ